MYELFHRFFPAALFQVGEPDFPLMDGNIQGYFDQSAVFQFFLDKFFDDASHSQTDLGKFDQQIHGGHLDGVVEMDLVFDKIIVDVAAGHIFLV